jgi:hypothetical protein
MHSNRFRVAAGLVNTMEYRDCYFISKTQESGENGSFLSVISMGGSKVLRSQGCLGV